MDNHQLSSEELRTIEAYKEIAKARGETHDNPDFWRPEFEEFRKLLPAGKIIDLGCGSGRDALLFTQAGYRYVGIDISEDMLLEAKNLVPKADFVQMNMYSLGFPFMTFDGFWAPVSLLHIPKRNLRMVLQEIKRIIKPNGIGFLVMKEGRGERMVRGPYKGDERFFVFYQENGFLKILQNEGFEILEHRKDGRANTAWLLYFVKVKPYYKVVTEDLKSVGLLGATPIQYKIGEWVYPLEPLSDHPRKGGGLWVLHRRCDARSFQRYVKRKHGLDTRIFTCLIGKIIPIKPNSNHRTKTNKVKLLEEIT